jgi:hypothetical protein
MNDSNQVTTPPLLTLRQVGDLARATGLPITQKTLEHYCKPCIAKGPKPVMRWGNRKLFDPAQCLEWIRAQLRPVEGEHAA